MKRHLKYLCNKFCKSFTSIATYAAPLLIIIAWLVSVIVDPAPVIMVTQHYPPYQIINWEAKTASGETVEYTKCALERMGYRYHIVPYRSWGEAQETVRTGKADALLGALHTMERDMYANWSDPAGFHFLQFISLADNKETYDSPKARFAVKEASGTSSQIVYSNKHIISYVGPNNQSLIVSLLENKADFIYMDYKVFEYEARQLGISNINSRFSFRPGSSQGYGVYWSHKYLKMHPGFLDKFNDNLRMCLRPV